MWRRAFQRSLSTLKTGQPIHETRPNLIRKGDITPFISAVEYFQRRIKLAQRLPTKSLAIIPSNIIKYASGAVFYQFQQNNDLFYLSGWNEPDSVLVLAKPTDNIDDLQFHLIVPPKEPAIELWEGQRTGEDAAIEIFNADEAHSNKDMERLLTILIKSYDTVYYDFSSEKSSKFKRFFTSAFKENRPENRHTIEAILRENNKIIKPLTPHLSSLRAIKSNSELRLMQLASKISAKAYNMAYSTHLRSEKGLDSFLSHNFKLAGCDDIAYIPVVAGGSNALCIHYTRNDAVLKDGDLVLVDAAGKLGGYCSDISRTWPVNASVIH
ncbi:unnamed protein product [Ambrosiozyma monospora]|uniref:Unnamed protein product n=1 Tax=Ambrosiozyma monospora TaxID=43982 RepID=A0ACB5TLA6_AMBMO|nr:unnamed protein product [Ambrosiozyma monospora]